MDKRIITTVIKKIVRIKTVDNLYYEEYSRQINICPNLHAKP